MRRSRAFFIGQLRAPPRLLFARKLYRERSLRDFYDMEGRGCGLCYDASRARDGFPYPYIQTVARPRDRAHLDIVSASWPLPLEDCDGRAGSEVDRGSRDIRSLQELCHISGVPHDMRAPLDIPRMLALLYCLEFDRDLGYSSAAISSKEMTDKKEPGKIIAALATIK